MTTSRWRWVSIPFLFSSLMMLIFIIYVFSRRPDALAVITILPFWAWGFAGICLTLPGLFLKKKSHPVILCLVWIATIIIGSDESTSLFNIGISRFTEARPVPPSGHEVIRVATFNCALHKSDPLETLKRYQPDIIFLQEVLHHGIAKKLTSDLFGKAGSFSTYRHGAIIVHGSIIKKKHILRNSRNHHITIKRPDGTLINLVNIHLPSSSTRLDLWKKGCWRDHKAKRLQRIEKLERTLKDVNTRSYFPNSSTIIAGDFNAPPSDAVHNLLNKDFTNAFENAGRGWGNTYHTGFPVLRIDHIYTSDTFTPLRARVLSLPDSDHKMLITDLIRPLSPLTLPPSP